MLRSTLVIALAVVAFSAIPVRAQAPARSDLPYLLDFDPAAVQAPPAAPSGATVASVAAAAAEADDALRCLLPATADEICHDLDITYTTSTIWNPARGTDGGYDTVRLRSYVDHDRRASGERPPFVAPAIQLVPGQTFRLTLRNTLPRPEEMRLPDGTTCGPAPGDMNTPHCSHFNLTNMHVHGVWVSPQGNSDNVLLSIAPGQNYQYEYNIPSDHPAGTFWYHPHRHGSTAPQVSSGMAGALIIRGSRVPELGADGTWTRPGDVDRLLMRAPAPLGETLAAYHERMRRNERVFLFQQVPYACRGPDGRIFRVGGGATGPWDQNACAPETEQTVEPGPVAFDVFGPNRWKDSGRYTMINGRVRPAARGGTVEEPIAAGEVQRWRLIHAGVRESIRLRIVRTDPSRSRSEIRAVAAGAAADAAPTLCELDDPAGTVPVFGLATDGLTRPRLDPRASTWLHPGYREDLLVSFPAPGTYCLVNDGIADEQGVNRNGHGPLLLDVVTVDPAPAAGAARPACASGADAGTAACRQEEVLATLDRLAAQNFDGGVRDRIVADLHDAGGVRLDAFVKHKPIDTLTMADGVPLRQRVAFQIGGNGFVIGNLTGPLPELGNTAAFGIEPTVPQPQNPTAPQPYDPARVDRVLRLGASEEWWIAAINFGPHPFHIHVNPFEVREIWAVGQKGCGTPCARAKPTDPSTWVRLDTRDFDDPQNQYAGLNGTFKDTIAAADEVLIKVRTRYQRYIGDFVLHGHILDHEDQGMMQNVSIRLDADTPPSAARSTHQHQ